MKETDCVTLVSSWVTVASTVCGPVSSGEVSSGSSAGAGGEPSTEYVTDASLGTLANT